MKTRQNCLARKVKKKMVVFILLLRELAECWFQSLRDEDKGTFKNIKINLI